ncbi:unnamed protein product [Malus baccata var. baccata]
MLFARLQIHSLKNYDRTYPISRDLHYPLIFILVNQQFDCFLLSTLDLYSLSYLLPFLFFCICIYLNRNNDEAYVNFNWDKLGFGLTPTDYIYIMKISGKDNFSEGSLSRYGNIEISPSAAIFNYGQGLFEGLKAYRRPDGGIQLFRPELNAMRMKNGADRLCMPSPPVDVFIDAVKKTVLANQRWVPPPGKGSLYIRPLLMGSGPVLGIGPAPECTFLIFTSPIGNWYKCGPSMSLYVENEVPRATPGGTGAIKSITNYSPVFEAVNKAKAKGFTDVLFLDAATGKNVEEVSSCNVFIVKDNVILTPPTNGTILPGVTRKSIIEIALHLNHGADEKHVDAMNWDELEFGVIPTDYMYIMICSDGENFSQGHLAPYRKIELSPFAGILNYGQGILEGLKAIRTKDGRIQLFRPEENALRMKTGAERLCMPCPSTEQFLAALKQAVLANKRWVPPSGKGVLYIRPLLIGSGSVLGLGSATEYTFLIFATPIGSYHKSGSTMNLYIENEVRRATPGGTGGIKSITNYSPIFKTVQKARAEGFTDVLFLDAATGKNIEECSSSNIFIVKDNVILTPPTNGTVLPGITRKSIIEIALHLNYVVEERDVSLEDVLAADEVFCTGTAVDVIAVSSITYRDKGVEYRRGKETVFCKLREMLTEIQTGLIEDKMGPGQNALRMQMGADSMQYFHLEGKTN